ncbi:MAG: DUF2807 domain-containing protein, partial [Saprospiraceae bacterium]|nr:DUF2807 domain-containing protein [Saprospiraceae bacterium]
MKKNPIIQMSILSAFILISFQLIACNCCLSNEKQDVVTQVREVVDFDGIIVSGAFNVFISQGETQVVKIVAPEEIMEKIQTDVKSGKLSINNKGRIKCYNDIKIFLTVKSLNSIIASGASDIKTQSLINATVFKLILSGAGDVDLNLSCDDLNCVVSGA